jgi:hypothetical protein
VSSAVAINNAQEELEMKRHYGNFRLLAGALVAAALMPASFAAAIPIVNIEAPLGDQPLVLGKSVRVIASVEAPDAPILTVEVYRNGTLVGSAQPGGGKWGLDLTVNSLADFDLFARAIDAEGNLWESDTFTYEVIQTDAPVVSILSPFSGSRYLPGTNLPIQVLATDGDGLISRVDFLLDGIVVSSVVTPPFRTEIQLPSIGEYVLTARAFDDLGVQADSDPIILEAGPMDESTPRVVIDFPLPLGGGDTVNDVSYASSMFLNATAMDPDGTIEEVRFYINGQLLGSADGRLNDVFSLFFDPNALGNYIIAAEAIDNDGNSGWSVPLTLNVGPLERPLPKARVHSPAGPIEAGEQVRLFADADGGLIEVNRVDFFIDGVYIGSSDEPEAEGTSLYSLLWTPELTGDFDLQIRVVQIDPAEAEWDNWRISEPVAISVVEELDLPKPEVGIFAPSDGSVYPTGTRVPVQLSAFDSAGIVEEIELFLNGVMILRYIWQENNQQWSVEPPWPNIVPDADIPFRSYLQLPSAGAYTLHAKATSSTGRFSMSEPVVMIAKDLTADPSLSIITPVSGSRYLPGTILPVQVEAYDPGGLITQVEFLLNDVVVDTVTQAPFRTAVQLPSTGTYRLSARSTTHTGAQGFSQEVVLEAGPPDAVTPRVVIDHPLPLGAGDTVNDVSYASAMFFNATVEDPDGGSIEEVLFFINGQLLGNAAAQIGNAHSLFFKPSSQGNYVVTARATDNDGNVGWSAPLLLDVGPLERPLPVARMVEPFPESALGETIDLFVDASGGLIPISRVDFYADGVFLGSVEEPLVGDRYTLKWTPPALGVYDLQARVVQIDPAGADWDNWRIAEPVQIEIIDAATGPQPRVELTNPETGMNSVVLRPILLQADAFDPLGGIEEVRFYVNGKEQAVDVRFPYQTWFTPQSPGLFQIVAESLTDRGLRARSTPVTVNVLVTDLPSGEFVSPAGVNPTAGSDVMIEVAADDPDGYVESVEFYINGVAIAEPDTSAPFSTFWRPGSAGQYDLSALITDNSGNPVLISKTVTVNPPVGVPPRVTLSVTGSGNVTPGSRVVVRASVFDDDPEDMSVAFFMNGNLLGTDATPPFTIIVDPEVGFDNNAYSLTAVASDKDGNSRADDLFPLYISDFSVDQPSIDILSIQNGDQVTLGSRVPIGVEILGGAARRLSNVVFYADGIEIGRIAGDQRSFDWIPDRSGTIEITAATLLPPEFYDHDRDSGGMNPTPMIPVTPVNVASPVTVTVNAPVGALPSISLNVLPARDNLAIGSRILLYADAQDLDGSISQVEFFLDGMPVGSSIAPPFTQVLTTAQEGEFTLNALATDSDGNVVTSTVVPIKVAPRVVTQTPEVTLSVPDSGQEGNALSLRASTEGFVLGPESVVFHVNGVEVGSSSTLPYSYSWLANLSGAISFFATAQQTLPDGVVVTAVSEVIGRFLGANEPPQITGFSMRFPRQDPESKPNPYAGETLDFEVLVQDSGPIQTVELLRDGESVGFSSSSGVPYRIDDLPPGAGTYRYSVVVTDRGGLQTQSSTLGVTVEQGEGAVINVPEILSFRSNLVGGSSLINLPIEFTVEAVDEEGIERVELLLGGAVVASVFAEPYTMTITPTEAGNYSFIARVTNTQGNDRISDPILLNVRHPDPLGQITDFVYQTFLDLLLRTPALDERNGYAGRINRGDLTRDRFIRELINPADGQADSEYDPVRSVLLANRFLLGQWPTREELEADVATVKDGGLQALISSLMIPFEPLYIEAVGAGVSGLPDIFSADADISRYVTYLFERKYGVNPSATQLSLAKLHFLASGRDSFTASFIADVEVIATGSSFITIGLGFQFPASSPPSDQYLREADAASLLINLLRIVPETDEVTALSEKLFAIQVAEVLADPRYAARFTTAFQTLEHHANGWKRSEWFGVFNTLRAPWVYHIEQGWILFETTGNNEQNFRYYDPALGWVWTDANLFPVIYSEVEHGWFISSRETYSPDRGRRFLDLGSQQWIQR